MPALPTYLPPDDGDGDGGSVLPAGVAGHGAVVLNICRPRTTDSTGERQRAGGVLGSHHSQVPAQIYFSLLTTQLSTGSIALHTTLPTHYTPLHSTNISSFFLLLGNTQIF